MPTVWAYSESEFYDKTDFAVGIELTTFRCRNKCRIYLRAFLLTDIVTGCGKKIRKTVWEGTRDTQNSDPSILWPEWKHPPTKMWTV